MIATDSNLDGNITQEVSAACDSTNYTFRNTPDNFQGGKISAFYDQWELLTSDKWLLDCVKGLKIEMEHAPMQHFIPKPILFSIEDRVLIDQEIQNMLLKGIIERIDIDDYITNEYISNIFFKVKKDGKLRIILNLKSFNKVVDYHHFKMETLQCAINLVQTNSWFASIDLKDAFHSVKVAPTFRKYLRFIWNGNKYQYTCMPNGLSSAPRIWTKLLKPVFSYLRKNGYANVAYIDDSFLQAQTFDACLENIKHTVQIVDRLGLTVHPTKSVLVPTQEITFVGFVLNSLSMQIRLTDEKADCLIQLCTSLLRKLKPTIRDLAQLIGKMVSSEPGVMYAPLFYKSLEIEKNKFLKTNKGDYDAFIQLSQDSRDMIQWWIDNVKDSSKPMSHGHPTISLYSDSSSKGWGGINKTCGTETSGHWSAIEQTEHINVLELKAAFLTLKALCSDSVNEHVRINLDSTVALSYVQKMGGGRSEELNDIARDMWLWCRERSIWLSTAHVPGVLNVEADQLSRSMNIDMEWAITDEVFNVIHYRYGTLSIDLFASRINKRLTNYVSYSPDSQAYAIDALTLDWSLFELSYAFPPFSILGQCLKKIMEDGAEVLLIAPLWTTQTWFPILLSMISDHSYILPKSQDILFLPQDLSRKHHLQKMRLGVFRLSGNPLSAREYQKNLLTLSQTHGEIQQESNIGVISSSGCNFVLQNKLIHLNHL